jgi:hypothetical protein
MGHAGEDMSDLYDKIKEDVAFRRKWAERCECTENCRKKRSSKGSLVPKQRKLAKVLIFQSM